MNLHDLAALVEVRNHIPVLLNNKNLTTKGDFRVLVNAMNKLDQQFVEAVKALDYDNLFPPDMRCVTISSAGDIQLSLKELPYHTSGYIHVESTKDVMEGVQILSPANPNATIKLVNEPDLSSSPSGIWEDLDDDIPDEPIETPVNLGPTEVDAFFEDQKQAMKAETDCLVSLVKGAKDTQEKEDPEAVELAMIANRVKDQKEQLKKQGRSNKRVSKSKEDDAKK